MSRTDAASARAPADAGDAPAPWLRTAEFTTAHSGPGTVV